MILALLTFTWGIGLGAYITVRVQRKTKELPTTTEKVVAQLLDDFTQAKKEGDIIRRNGFTEYVKEHPEEATPLGALLDYED